MAKLTYQPEGLVGKLSVDWMRADIWSQLLVTAEQESQWETFLDTLAHWKLPDMWSQGLVLKALDKT